MRIIAPSALLGLLAFGAAAGAETLVSVPVPIHNFFARGFPMGAFLNDVVFSIGLRPVPPPGQQLPLTPISNEIFDGVRLSAADIGRTVRLTAADDPDFAGFVSMLTNGVADEALVASKTFAEGGYVGAPEATSQHVGVNSEHALLSVPASLDLRGFQIDAITERLDSLTITDNVVPVPSAPEIYGRQFDGQVTLTVEGTATPEPGMGMLMVLGAAMVGGRRRRPR
jgi:hypothetical protein